MKNSKLSPEMEKRLKDEMKQKNWSIFAPLREQELRERWDENRKESTIKDLQEFKEKVDTEPIGKYN